MSYTEINNKRKYWHKAIALILTGFFLFFAAKAFALEVTWSEGPDCPYPSTWVEVENPDGTVSHIVKQDTRCLED